MLADRDGVGSKREKCQSTELHVFGFPTCNSTHLRIVEATFATSFPNLKLFVK